MKIEITESHKRAFEGHPQRQPLKFVKGQILEVGKDLPAGMSDRIIASKMGKKAEPAVNKITKDAIIAKLVELEIEHDPKAKKDVLEALLPAVVEE